MQVFTARSAHDSISGEVENVNISFTGPEGEGPDMGSPNQCKGDGDCKEGMKCEEGTCRVVPFQCESDADCSECNECVSRRVSMPAMGYACH